MSNNWDLDGPNQLECIQVGPHEIRVGDRVRLNPSRRADIMDIVLAGKTATIEAIEQDFEKRIYLAVVVDDDPGADFGRGRQPGHRFFYSPDEVEPLGSP
jgi:hypothetical protein